MKEISLMTKEELLKEKEYIIRGITKYQIKLLNYPNSPLILRLVWENKIKNFKLRIVQILKELLSRPPTIPFWENDRKKYKEAKSTKLSSLFLLAESIKRWYRRLKS